MPHSVRTPRVPKVMLAVFLALSAFGSAAHARTNDEAASTVLVFGDSLSAAYGMASEQGWVRLLDARLAERGWRAVNASMSGETSSGGVSRLPAALREHRPRLVLLELGANDALRGLPLEMLERNLLRMTELSTQQGAEVVLIGMQMPPNFGSDFTRLFSAVYERVAAQSGARLLPFLLEPIAEDRSLFQADQIHPTVAAQSRIADHVWAVLDPLVGAAQAVDAP